MRKLAKKILNKVKEKTLSELEQHVASLEGAQNENNRLTRELIVEQRQRDAKYLGRGIFQISDREVVTLIFSGFIMYLDPKDMAVAPHIILEGIWERQITKAWLAVLLKKRDAIVVDIGANFGYFGMLAAQHLDHKKSQVFMFEANPNLLPYIHKTLTVNWLNENTVVEGLAVSDKNGTAQLNVLEDYIGSSSMHSLERLDSYLSHKMSIKAESVIDVKTVTIDSYCADNKIDHIDIMKMDIEGYEEKAYAGMRKIVNSSPEMILFVEFTKDGYENPKKYYEEMLKDFGNVYTIGSEGEFILPTNISYEAVVDSYVDDWIMLVFSRKVLEHTNHKRLSRTSQGG